MTIPVRYVMLRGETPKSRGQFGWAFADQLLSSGTNLAVSIFVARLAGPEEFGVYALTVGIWLSILGVTRSLVMQPFTIRASPANDAEWRTETRSGSGLVAILGFGIGGVMAIVGWIFGTSIGLALIALGIFTAPLMIQEFWRVAAFSRSSARTAFVNDAAWATVQVAALAFLAQRQEINAALALSAWGLGSLAGALAGIAQFRLLPDISRTAFAWLKQVGGLGGWFAASSTTYQLGEQATLWIIAGVAGTETVGGLRVAEQIFGPIRLVGLSAESITLPMAAIASKQCSDEVVRVSRNYSAALAALATAYLVIAVLSTEWVLETVFGDEYLAFANLVVPLGLAMVMGTIASGAALGLRALERGRSLFLAQLASTAVRLLLVGTLVLAFGAIGAAWGISVSITFMAIVFWLYLAGRRAVRAQQNP